ncbi:ATP-grasp domain-containing protein [Pleionea sediminis]|uniref:ATP-grasp domain-containing protein n=1 Tax=Pleionea sediminis TaxID=2569479 RepID=UPI001185E04D|nr:hypothetical protein [Pleionea sediminis]
MYDVVLLTEDAYINTSKQDWYTLQVLLEDALVKDALEQQGFNVAIKSWSDPAFDWSTADSVLFRTTWDYFDRFSEFSIWLDHIRPLTRSINSIETLLWNLDKRYLLDLNKRGVNSVETHILPKNDAVNLTELLNRFEYQDAILKPVVSGAARHTYRINHKSCNEIQPLLDTLIQHEDFMIQPFQNNILKQGELSLMVMNGKFTHAVKKVAAKGDFRVQDDHGGTVHPYQPTNTEIEFAERAIASCDPMPLYGRVDMIYDNQNSLSIMELELIEPELFFRFHRPAAFALAEGVKEYLDK